ncbi:MAG: efflux RND transporter periplasmic adaptor subunit [Phycisphaerales bacterium JB039]
MSELRRAARRGSAPVKIIAAIALVGAAAGVGWLMVGRSSGSAAASAADIATVSVGSFDITTIATGDLQARRQVEIRSELDVRAQIVQLVDEGVRVKAGDVLVKLNSEEIEREIQEETLRVEEARSALTSAENAVLIQVSENESRMRQAELTLELANLALRQWEEGDVKKRREELRIALEKAERDYERLKEKAENSAELYERNFKSKNDFEVDQIAAIEAQARLTTAKLDHDIYETYTYAREEKQKRSDVEEAIAELERVKKENESKLASEQAQLANRRRQLEIRENKLSDLTDQLEKTTIRAPKEGLVVYYSSAQGRRMWDDNRGTLQVGREVNPRETLIVLPDTAEMIASVQVHETIAGRVNPGQSATVRIDALGGAAVNGVVESVGVLAESGGWRDPNLREYNVRIALDSAAEGLKPSMRCEAEIRLGRVEEALSAPVAAIFNEGALHFVYSPRDGKYHRVPVSVGRRSSTRVEITSGLGDGDLVLAREPAAAEVLAEAWDQAELQLVGFDIGDDGRPHPIGAKSDGEADSPRRPGPGRQRPGGPGRGASQSGETTSAPAAPEAQRGAVAPVGAGADTK